MDLRGLREVILEDPQIDEEDEVALAEDEAKNGEAYAELVQCLDQGFSTGGPWPPGGPRRYCRGSATC